MTGSQLHTRLRAFTTFTLDGHAMQVCPAVVLFLVAAFLNSANSLALAWLILLVIVYLGVWVLKLRAQLWLARVCGLSVARVTLVPFAPQLVLEPGGRADLHRDVHLLGLAVLFGIWAALSLLATAIELPRNLNWMAAQIAGVAFLSGIVALVPVLGLDGAQALRHLLPRRLGPALAWTQVFGQALAVATGLFLAIMGIIALGRGDGAELALILAFAATSTHVYRSARDFGTDRPRG